MPLCQRMSGARIGNGNTIYQGAVVAPFLRILHFFTGEENDRHVFGNDKYRFVRMP